MGYSSDLFELAKTQNYCKTKLFKKNCYDFLLILLKLFSIALLHFVGTKPQVAVVVVVVAGTVLVVVVECKVVEVVSEQKKRGFRDCEKKYPLLVEG